MYVIFPADEVVQLTYGRVIIPRKSTSRTPSRIQSERSSIDYNNSRRCSSNPPEDTQIIESLTRNSYIIQNGTNESDSTNYDNTLAKSKSLNRQSTEVSTLQRDKSANRSFFNKGSVKRERSPKSDNIQPPTLGPDPRLQITNLQDTPQEKSPVKRKSLFGTRVKKQSEVTMASVAGVGESTLRELTHPSFNEAMKSHNSVTFKLVRTVSDFTQQLSQIYEQHAEELQMLVSNFRKRNGELRKERPACPSSLFHTWETLLQEVEIDSQAHSDIASILGRQVSRPLLEKSFHRKIQSRKVFTHRESYETIISKTEEKLVKCRQDYKNAYLSYLSVPTTASLSAYFDSHNAYVQQLHATNGMLDEYSKETLPQLLQELEEIYSDLCTTLSESVLQGAEVVSARAMEQYKRYEGLSSQCKAVSGATDLAHFVRSLPSPPHNRTVVKRLFCPPQPPIPDPSSEDGDKNIDIQNENIPPPLKNELVVDRLASIQIKPSHEALKKEASELEIQIKQIQDALDTLVRIQQRSLESNLFNKVNELQEDISMKRFDLRVAQIHLSAINSQLYLCEQHLYRNYRNEMDQEPSSHQINKTRLQLLQNPTVMKELFSNKLESSSDSGRERKMSAASTGSMKSKWLKAFKSLKTPPSSGAASPREAEKKNGAAGGRDVVRAGESDVHNFQEYTYKKITPCDICSQVLRGHTRQGLRCRICKMNVHVDCQDKVGRCQSKSRLLRRQKSTSEIETKVPEATLEEESQEDMFYGMSTLNRQISFKESSSRPQSLELESPEVDLIYQVLKQAGEISNTKPRSSTDNVNSNDRRTNEGTRMEDRPPVGILVNDRSGSGSAPGSSGSSGQSLNRRGQPSRPPGSSLTVSNPVPHSTSSERRSAYGGPSDGSMRRRLFAGMKSLTGFGSRSRHGSPHNRSISLPETPHSPRRQKLNLRMKSLSLDSPESTEHVQRRRHVGTAGTSEPHSNHSSSSRIQSPSSPVHNRRLLSARNMRMSSVELPDDNEKSLSSASTSPCPSPVGGKKSHRLLPTNLYVVLYNFKARHQDELDLKAGYKVTVIDTSDPDWWKGKCLGRVGYFPSKYCSKLAAGEKPLQVTHNLQVSDGDNGLMLLRDQIVIQVGEELDGMVMIRSGDNRQGVCPLKFLQEV